MLQLNISAKGSRLFVSENQSIPKGIVVVYFLSLKFKTNVTNPQNFYKFYEFKFNNNCLLTLKILMNAHSAPTIVIVKQHVSIQLDRLHVVVMSVIPEMESHVMVRKIFHWVIIEYLWYILMSWSPSDGAN